MRQNKIALNGPIIRQKALQYSKELNISNFSASVGWFERFKKRNGITWRPIVGDSDAVNREVTEGWIQAVLTCLLGQFSDDDIYNFDEFALFYKATPNKTMCFKGELCCDGKLSKERLSVLAGVNMSGKLLAAI